jgi:hypothetical protein
VRTLEDFWLGAATLPRRDGHSIATGIDFQHLGNFLGDMLLASYHALTRSEPKCVSRMRQVKQENYEHKRCYVHLRTNIYY